MFSGVFCMLLCNFTTCSLPTTNPPFDFTAEDETTEKSDPKPLVHRFLPSDAENKTGRHFISRQPPFRNAFVRQNYANKTVLPEILTTTGRPVRFGSPNDFNRVVKRRKILNPANATTNTNYSIPRRKLIGGNNSTWNARPFRINNSTTFEFTSGQSSQSSTTEQSTILRRRKPAIMRLHSSADTTISLNTDSDDSPTSSRNEYNEPEFQSTRVRRVKLVSTVNYVKPTQVLSDPIVSSKNVYSEEFSRVFTSFEEIGEDYDISENDGTTSNPLDASEIDYVSKAYSPSFSNYYVNHTSEGPVTVTVTRTVVVKTTTNDFHNLGFTTVNAFQLREHEEQMRNISNSNIVVEPTPDFFGIKSAAAAEASVVYTTNSGVIEPTPSLLEKTVDFNSLNSLENTPVLVKTPIVTTSPLEAAPTPVWKKTEVNTSDKLRLLNSTVAHTHGASESSRIFYTKVLKPFATSFFSSFEYSSKYGGSSSDYDQEEEEPGTTESPPEAQEEEEMGHTTESLSFGENIVNFSEVTTGAPKEDESFFSSTSPAGKITVTESTTESVGSIPLGFNPNMKHHHDGKNMTLGENLGLGNSRVAFLVKLLVNMTEPDFCNNVDSFKKMIANVYSVGHK